LARRESADDERFGGLVFELFIFRCVVRERYLTLFSLSWVRLVHGELTFVVVVLHGEEMKDRILVEFRWNSFSYVASFGCYAELDVRVSFL
jgi:hypothetical protein